MKGFWFQQNDSPAQRACRRSARGIILVSSIFCIAIGVLGLANYEQMRRGDPVNDPKLIELREEYSRTGEASLKHRIRALDFVMRKEYFARREQVSLAITLLLVGLAVLLVAMKIESLAARRLPVPSCDPVSESDAITMAGARKAVALTAIGFAVGATALYLMFDTNISLRGIKKNGEEKSSVAGGEYVFPSAGEIMENWGSFRGPYGLGIAGESDPPVRWSVVPKTNFLWKTPVPRMGFSSPVVWGNRAFVTGADKQARELYCYSVDTGDLLWRREVGSYPGSSQDLPEVTDDTGLAAPTPAVDGQSVVAIFGTGDVACFTLDGDLRWGKNIGLPGLNYGYSSSPVIHKEHVLIQYHQDTDSRLLALDVRTGNQKWVKWQKSRAAWGSPALITDGPEDLLVVSGNPMVTLHVASSGEQKWQVECTGGEPAPSPAYADGIVFAASDYYGLTAISRESGRKLWTEDTIDLPDVSSPLAVDDLLFICSSFGTVSCLEAKTGRVLWKKEFTDGFYSSPVFAGGRVYAATRDGTVYVFDADREYKAVAKAKTGENVDATPAFSGKKVFVRGRKALYCFGKEE